MLTESQRNANLVLIVQAAKQAETPECPARFLAAQCVLESGCLEFAPGNNPFGIKAYPGCSGKQLLRTTEWFSLPQLGTFLTLDPARTASAHLPTQSRLTDGTTFTLWDVHDWFATFPDLASAFALRVHLAQTPLYKPFGDQYAQDHDLEKLVLATAKVYSTSDPDAYANLIMQQVAAMEPLFV